MTSRTTDTFEDVRYILRSSYPDGSFRGLEKSMPLLFDTAGDAQEHLQRHVPLGEHGWWSVVPVVVVTPAVRRPLDAVVQTYPHLFELEGA